MTRKTVLKRFLEMKKGLNEARKKISSLESEIFDLKYDLEDMEEKKDPPRMRSIRLSMRLNRPAPRLRPSTRSS